MADGPYGRNPKTGKLYKSATEAKLTTKTQTNAGAAAYAKQMTPPVVQVLGPMNYNDPLSADIANIQAQNGTQGAADAAAADPFAEWLSQYGTAGGGGGGGGGGYNLGGELGAIAEAYNTRLAELDRQRQAGDTEIGAARKASDEAIKGRSADNQAQSAQINQSIMANYAAALQRQQNESAALAAELQRQGVDPSRLAPGTTQSASYVQQMRDAQGALQQRMGQVQGDALSARNANMDLIAQGATGVLANNYASTKMQMDLQRQAQEDAARQAAAAAAARGGGGSSKDPMEAAMDELKLRNEFNKLTGNEPISASDFLKQNGNYALGVLQPGTPAYIAASAANQGGNVDSVLRNLYTSSEYDPLAGKDVETFNASGYGQAYDRLSLAKNAQRQVASQGYSPLIGANRFSTQARNALSKLNFRTR